MPPADGSSMVAYRFAASQAIYVNLWIQKSWWIFVCPQAAHLWWPAMAKLQAASVPVAYAAAPCSQCIYSLDSCVIGQADGWTDRRSNCAIAKYLPRAGVHNNALTQATGYESSHRVCKPA